MPFSFRFPIALILSILYLATPAWADLLDCKIAVAPEKDFATALLKLRPLAEKGDAMAQFHLAVLYKNGCGVPQNYGQARQWWEKAAAQGDAEIQYRLGLVYEIGPRGLQDFNQARKWYEQAAAQGYSLAQINLGLLYAEGRGVSQDFVQAHKWFILAGAAGYNHGVELRDALAKQMTSVQIVEAQRLARGWKPKTP